MIETKTFPKNRFNSFAIQAYRLVFGRILPQSLFCDKIPAAADRKAVNGKFNLEIVSHCWGYANMLTYQLSSFVNYPPSKLNLTVTVFYSEEDTKTNKLKMKSIVLNWKNLVPLTLLINLPWGGFIEVDDFIENETFGQIITRLGLHPRDGTNVSIEDEGKNLSRIKVSRYHGKTVNFVVEREHEAESFDLDE